MSTSPTLNRIDISRHAPKAFAAMYRFQRSIEVDRPLAHLVMLRASQVNGCAYCIDMHVKDARLEGVDDERLYMLPAWRETPLYTDRERAALELTEAMTRITDGHVPDDVWATASASFDEGELANLVMAITAINAWNRIAITSRTEPGLYDPEQAPAAA